MSDEVINLPYGFKKCLFLKGTGTQYINTNYIPTLKTGIKIKWAFDSVFVEDWCPIIGGLQEVENEEQDDPLVKSFYVPQIDGGYFSIFGTQIFLTEGEIPSDYQIVESSLNYLNSKEISFGETSLGTILEEEIEIIWTKPLHLFSINDTSSNTKNCFTGRFYRVTITENDKVEMDLIPCLDDKGRPCMYDLIYQKTFYNENSDGADFKYCIEGKIPPYYKRVQYLESTGTQWIDTGIITDGTYNIGIKYQPRIKSDGTLSTSYLCGRSDHWNCPSPIPDEYGDSMVYFDGTDSLIYTYSRKRYRMHKSLNPDYVPADVTDVIWKEGDNKITINGITTTLQNWSTDTINTNNALNKTYWIFETNTTRLPRSGSKIFNFRIQKDDIYVFYGLPIIDEHGVACMFDLVTAKPFYNAGTGSFIYFPTGKFEANYTNFCQLGVIGNRLGTGDEGLPYGYTRLKYLQSSGTQYIEIDEPFYLNADKPSCGAKLKIHLHTRNLFNPLWGVQPFNSPVVGNTSMYIGRGSDYRFGVLIYAKTSVQYDELNTIWEGEYNYLNSKLMRVTLADGQSKHGDYMLKTWKASAESPKQLLFGMYDSSTGDISKGIGRIYEAQFTNGTKITRYLIPCLDFNGRPCMFDKVSRKTFYNKGTGEFLYGYL